MYYLVGALPVSTYSYVIGKPPSCKTDEFCRFNWNIHLFWYYCTGAGCHFPLQWSYILRSIFGYERTPIICNAYRKTRLFWASKKLHPFWLPQQSQCMYSHSAHRSLNLHECNIQPLSRVKICKRVHWTALKCKNVENSQHCFQPLNVFYTLLKY